MKNAVKPKDSIVEIRDVTERPRASGKGTVISAESQRSTIQIIRRRPISGQVTMGQIATHLTPSDPEAKAVPPERTKHLRGLELEPEQAQARSTLGGPRVVYMRRGIAVAQSVKQQTPDAAPKRKRRKKTSKPAKDMKRKPVKKTTKRKSSKR